VETESPAKLASKEEVRFIGLRRNGDLGGSTTPAVPWA
jgi:hypothetical protein